MKTRREGDSRRKSRLTARTADKHVLYERSVQCPEADASFFDRVYRRTYGETPWLLREDFCGTAALCCEWVRRRKKNRALGVDLDPGTLAWSREHKLAKLGADSDRVTLIRDDVLKVKTRKVQIVASLNFSYFTFKSRRVLLGYFRSVRRALDAKGLFVLDIMGGPESQIPQIEETDYGDFVYAWDQDVFNPITHDFLCYIHFGFPDGSRMRRAFTYDWRLWSVGEIRDLLEEAGFRNVGVYWEGTDEDGEGDGIFRLSLKGDQSPGWIAYITATP